MLLLLDTQCSLVRVTNANDVLHLTVLAVTEEGEISEPAGISFIYQVDDRSSLQALQNKKDPLREGLESISPHPLDCLFCPFGNDECCEVPDDSFSVEWAHVFA